MGAWRVAGGLYAWSRAQCWQRFQPCGAWRASRATLALIVFPSAGRQVRTHVAHRQQRQASRVPAIATILSHVQRFLPLSSLSSPWHRDGSCSSLPGGAEEVAGGQGVLGHAQRTPGERCSRCSCAYGFHRAGVGASQASALPTCGAWDPQYPPSQWLLWGRLEDASVAGDGAWGSLVS